MARVAATLLVVSVFVALALLLWYASQVVLLLFAAVLMAVILRTAGMAVARWTGMRDGWALVLVLVLTVAAMVGGVWLAAPAVSEQVGTLRENLQSSLDTLSTRASALPGGEQVMASASEARTLLLDNGTVWQRVGGVFTTTLGALSGLAVILFVGGFLAFDPGLYARGMMRLIPLAKRPRAAHVFSELGSTLQGWLLGQIISMAVLFLTTWVMLWALGVPLAFILALLTGIMTFVPYIGPLIALIPIVLVALVDSPALALKTGALFMVIQNVEANVIMPLVFQRMVHLPPALTIAGQLLLGAIFGVLGFILATPLTAVLLVAVQLLYVEDVLGDRMEAQRVMETPSLE